MDVPDRVQAEFMLTKLETSGGSKWWYWVPGGAILVFLFYATGYVLDPTNIRGWFTTSTHRIDIERLDERTTVPFRILRLEGQTFFHPPAGHPKLKRSFDDTSNKVLINELRKRGAVDEELDDWLYGDSEEEEGGQGEDEDLTPEEFLYGDEESYDAMLRPSSPWPPGSHLPSIRAVRVEDLA